MKTEFKLESFIKACRTSDWIMQHSSNLDKAYTATTLTKGIYISEDERTPFPVIRDLTQSATFTIPNPQGRTYWKLKVAGPIAYEPSPSNVLLSPSLAELFPWSKSDIGHILRIAPKSSYASRSPKVYPGSNAIRTCLTSYGASFKIYAPPITHKRLSVNYNGCCTLIPPVEGSAFNIGFAQSDLSPLTVADGRPSDVASNGASAFLVNGPHRRSLITAGTPVPRKIIFRSQDVPNESTVAPITTIYRMPSDGHMAKLLDKPDTARSINLSSVRNALTDRNVAPLLRGLSFDPRLYVHLPSGSGIAHASTVDDGMRGPFQSGTGAFSFSNVSRTWGSKKGLYGRQYCFTFSPDYNNVQDAALGLLLADMLDKGYSSCVRTADDAPAANAMTIICTCAEASLNVVEVPLTSGAGNPHTIPTPAPFLGSSFGSVSLPMTFTVTYSFVDHMQDGPSGYSNFIGIDGEMRTLGSGFMVNSYASIPNSDPEDPRTVNTTFDSANQHHMPDVIFTGSTPLNSPGCYDLGVSSATYRARADVRSVNSAYGNYLRVYNPVVIMPKRKLPPSWLNSTGPYLPACYPGATMRSAGIVAIAREIRSASAGIVTRGVEGDDDYLEYEQLVWAGASETYPTTLGTSPGYGTPNDNLLGCQTMPPSTDGLYFNIPDSNPPLVIAEASRYVVGQCIRVAPLADDNFDPADPTAPRAGILSLFRDH